MKKIASLIRFSDVADGYDKYYTPQGSAPSLYQRRFGEYTIPATEVIMVTKKLILALAANYPESFSTKRRKDIKAVERLKKFCENRKITAEEIYEFLVRDVIAIEGLTGESRGISLNIMDFGCGDGRHLPLYVTLAKVFYEYNVHLNFCCYDISKAGLEVYKEKALNQFGLKPEDGNPYRLHGDNISLKLVCSKNPDAPLYLQKAHIISQMRDGAETKAIKITGTKTQPVFDVSLCLFGVLAHIIDKDARGKILQMLFDVTKTSVLITVPTLKFLDDPEINIVERDFNRGVVKYKVQDIILPYAVFEGNYETQLHVRPNNLDDEIVSATSRVKINGFKFGVLDIEEKPVQYRRPTQVSHSLALYLQEYADSTNEDLFHNASYVYEEISPDKIREVEALNIRQLLDSDRLRLRQTSAVGRG